MDITKVAVSTSRAKTIMPTITSSLLLLLLKLEGEGVKEASTIPGGVEGNSTPPYFDGDTANGLTAIAAWYRGPRNKTQGNYYEQKWYKGYFNIT